MKTLLDGSFPCVSSIETDQHLTQEYEEELKHAAIIDKLISMGYLDPHLDYETGTYWGIADGYLQEIGTEFEMEEYLIDY